MTDLTIIGEDLVLAADKGRAFHEAFCILLERPEFEDRVGPHCQLGDTDVAALAVQANALWTALSSRGYDKLHIEQPLEISLPNGGSLTAVIDLLAEGEKGDSLPPRFSACWVGLCPVSSTRTIEPCVLSSREAFNMNA